ncbi:MAG: hypothetical protein WC718_10185 [Phycisphaerales bacterium]
MEDEKKKLITGTILIVACLVGAVFAYRALSGPSAVDTSKADAAAARVEKIRKDMDEAPKEPPPPEIERPKTRGPQHVGG